MLEAATRFQEVRQIQPQVKPTEISQSLEELSNLVSVILSYTALGISKLPSNSPARVNLERSLDAAEQLADLMIQLNQKVYNDAHFKSNYS
jgi:hypothetical protein